MRAMLCPCCAAHLLIGEGRSIVCNTCNSPLILVSEGGVSELRALPPQFVVPYSDPRRHGAGFSPGDLHRIAWDRVARRLYADWKFQQAGFWAFAVASVALLLGSVVAAVVLMASGRNAVEGPAACFVVCLVGAPVLGFVAAHFHEKTKLTEECLCDVFRHLSGAPRIVSRLD